MRATKVGCTRVTDLTGLRINKFHLVFYSLMIDAKALHCTNQTISFPPDVNVFHSQTPLNQSTHTSAIALAVEIQADQVLIDERRGRLVASRLNLRYTGILGILVEAKSQGLIAEVGGAF